MRRYNTKVIRHMTKFVDLSLNKKHPQVSEARNLMKKLIKATRNESWEI